MRRKERRHSCRLRCLRQPQADKNVGAPKKVRRAPGSVSLWRQVDLGIGFLSLSFPAEREGFHSVSLVCTGLADSASLHAFTGSREVVTRVCHPGRERSVLLRPIEILAALIENMISPLQIKQSNYAGRCGHLGQNTSGFFENDALPTELRPQPIPHENLNNRFCRAFIPLPHRPSAPKGERHEESTFTHRWFSQSWRKPNSILIKRRLLCPVPKPWQVDS